MDIMVSSNFERLLFDLHGRNGARDRRPDGQLQAGRRLQRRRKSAGPKPASCSTRWPWSDAQTCETIARGLRQLTGEVLDPHTAIGVKAARDCRRSLDTPMVILGTAHPVKFPEAVQKAGVGKALELPVHI
jgi:threonine synthase